jgi:hypothetical protein
LLLIDADQLHSMTTSLLNGDDNISKQNANDPRASSSLIETVMRRQTLFSNLIQTIR